MTPRFTLAVIREIEGRVPGFHLGMLSAPSPAVMGALMSALRTADLSLVMEIVRDGLRMETETDAGVEVDVVLAQLQDKTPGQRMTWRYLCFMALCAGLSLSDMGQLTPGEVTDLFLLRRRYDDQQHNIRRGKPAVYD